jgi:hypothetical protein
MNYKRLVFCLTLFACVLAGSFSPAVTQDPVAEPTIVEKPEGDPSATVYIPFEKLKEVLGQEGATAVLPYLDLQKLRTLLDQLQAEQPPAAVITSASYELRAEEEVARVTARLSVKSYREKWSEVSLPLSGATVGKVTADDERVVLKGTGRGVYSLFLPEPGEHQVELELLVKIQSSPDGKSIQFQTPVVGIASIEVVIPEQDQKIEIEPEAVSQPAEAGENESRVKFQLGAADHVRIGWAPRVGVKPQMELLTSVRNRLAVTLADGLVHTQSSMKIDVLRGDLSQVQLLVPRDHRILDVSAPQAKVKGWKAEEDDNGQIITVDLLQAVEKSLELEVHTERTLPEEPFPLAGIDEEGNVFGIHVRGAIRESGTLSISHSVDSQLTVAEQLGLIRVDAGDLPESERQAGQVHFKFYTPRFTLVAGIAPVEPRVTVKNQTVLTFQRERLRVQSNLSYAIERAGVFELRIKLPAEMTVESVNTDRMREYTIDDATGILTVSFLEKRGGSLNVNLVGHLKLEDSDEQQLSLPVPEPLQTFQETGTVSVFAPAALEIDSLEEETSGVHAEEVAAEGSASARLVGRWTFQSRPIAITVRTLRKPTRLTARVGSLVRINEDQAEVRCQVEFLIEHAPVRVFRVAVPESVSERIAIDVPPGKGQAIQVRTAAEEAVDGWITWTIRTQQEALGTQAFEIRFEIPLAREGDDHLSELKLLLPQVLPALTDTAGSVEIPLIRTIGEVAVSKDRSLSLSSELSAQGSEETLDKRELEMLAGEGDQAYRYFSQPAELTVRSRKYEIQSVVETVISRALIEVAVGYDPVARFRCRYLLNSSERQRLLVKLPKQAEPLSVLVDGALVDLETAEAEESDEQWDAYLVNVTRNKSSNDEFSLTIQFQWAINPPQFQTSLGNLQLGFPRIAGEGGSAAVQQMRLAIWIPDKFQLVGTPPQFNRAAPPELAKTLLGFPVRAPISEQELSAWISNVPTSSIEFPAEGVGYSFLALGDIASTQVRWWEMYWMVFWLSVPLALIGLVLMKTSWENKLGIVLLVLFAGAVYAVNDADTVANALAASRFGLATALGLWIVHSLFAARRSVIAPATAPASAANEPIQPAQPDGEESAG